MIRTVFGDIEKDKCGNVLMHEHIQCVSKDMLAAFGDKWLDKERLEDLAVSVLQKLKSQIALDIYVDGTAIDLGRDVRLLKSISQKTGVHIVASTGLYYYPSMLSCARSAEALAEWFLYECEKGMEGTGVKPGILKCAADSMGMTEDTEKRLRAAAITQAKTGLPMYAHCSHTNRLALDMMSLFERENTNPEKIIFGHASRRLEVDYLAEILKQGYYICIDQSFDGDEKMVAKTVYRLCEMGYENKLLFSQDRPIYNDFAAPPQLGPECGESVHITRYSFLQNKLVPEFEKQGINEGQCAKFVRENALDVLDI